eukprot:scaffold2535_cov336-Prasinococcus_capsulatus_cf.AAC.15
MPAGVTGGRVDHPVLLTVAPGTPLYSLTRLAQLLFDVYGVPALAFAYDGVCAHYALLQQGLAKPAAALLCVAGADMDELSDSLLSLLVLLAC